MQQVALNLLMNAAEATQGKTARRGKGCTNSGDATEESLAAMRASQPPVRYLVGVPKGRLTKLEKQLTELPWREARDQVQVKLLPEGGEVYVLVNSQARVDKERAMRRRRLKKLWARLKELRAMKDLSRDDL